MKQGVSAIIATILLVLITIIAVVMVAGFIIPMIKNQLKSGGSCFEAREAGEIDVYSGYTCSSQNETKIMIKRNYKELKGFAVSLESRGTSQNFKIFNGTSVPGVRMFSNENTLILPEQGGAETYVFSVGNIESSRLAVILKDDQICEPSFFEIPQC